MLLISAVGDQTELIGWVICEITQSTKMSKAELTDLSIKLYRTADRLVVTVDRF